MTMDDVKKIIKEENLKLYNLEADQPLREDQVVLRFQDDEWSVFATSERAAIEPDSIVKYKTESEALERFISRLRSANYILNHPLQV